MEDEKLDMEENLDLPPSDEIVDSHDFFAQLNRNPEDVLERYTQCPVCGGHLHFSHLTDFHLNTTQENMKCPECGIKVRQVLHRLM